MKICAACGREIRDGDKVHKYWIPERGETCCDSCKQYSNDGNNEEDAKLFRILDLIYREGEV